MEAWEVVQWQDPGLWIPLWRFESAPPSMARGRSLSAVVLAAGRSKRFGGQRPKVLHPLWGRSVLARVLDTLALVHRTVKITEVCVVVPPGRAVRKALEAERYPFIVNYATQKDPTGTGDAARIGVRRLARSDDVLVLAGDVPLVAASSLVELVGALRSSDAAAAVLTAVLDDAGAYGRIIRSQEWITGIVEARDATPDQLAIREINTCTYAFSRPALERVLPSLRPNNVQKEKYLTDSIGALVDLGEHVTSVEGAPEDVLGTNTRGEFARVASIVRERIIADLMDGGVTVIDPGSTYVDEGVRCGPDTVLRPGTILEGATVVGAGCQIGPSVHLVDTKVGDGATVSFAVARESKIGAEASVGPFASLRPGTVLARGAKAGTFAELKNARIGEGSKVPHLSYLGDVTVGRNANIGAGTITSNYDGARKYETVIGDEVFVGSDSILVAPVRVGRGAYTGAGSVVTRDVRPGELVYGVPAEPRKRGEGKKPARRRSRPAKAKPKKAKAQPKRTKAAKGRRKQS